MMKKFSIWMILGGLAVLAGLLALLGIIFKLLERPAGSIPDPTAIVVVIPAPTQTPLPLPTIEPSLTPTLTPVSGGGIQIGGYVQITGTGGDGLRLRSAAGTSNVVRFVAAESEVFQVKDGPVEADGMVWWYLITPYDANRTGWASAKYLNSIEYHP